MSDTTNSKNKKVVGIASLIAVGMFGFGFALIPLYNVFCDAFGINGSFTNIQNGTYNASEETKKALANGVDHSRKVEMQFLSSDSVGLNLDFYPMTKRLDFSPGEVEEVNYYIKNRMNKTITIQAIPDITPNLAKKYLAKIECFCFHKQTLKAGEERTMPLRFVVNSAIPRDIDLLTISYRFIDLDYKASIDLESGPVKFALFVQDNNGIN